VDAPFAFLPKGNGMSNYFIGATTVEAIKARYRRLAMCHHPDRGGDDEVMKVINRQYHEALRSCHGTSSKGREGTEHAYYYNEAVEQAVIEKIDELLRLSLPNIRVMLIGTWIWVDGETKLVKSDLMACGFRWHGQRKKWFWHNGYYRRGQSSGDFEHLANKYGYREFQSDQRRKIEA
jgi:hypothetical protein